MENSLYMQVGYEEYKRIETQMKLFPETVHRSTGGFYHKSIRIQITPTMVIEFHGPLVRAAEKTES